MGDGVCVADLFHVLSNDDTLSAMYCASPDYDECLGLCPDQDLAGIGVRVAFYLQSLMNAFIVVKSPGDSAQGAWSSTILTCALIIPAMIQKIQQTLSLYHATLILNFATLSTIASLAVAPQVPIWRRAGGPSIMGAGVSRGAFARAVVRVEREKEKAKGRTILSVALLTQIILQWAWCILMFVHPYYTQPACSPTTKLVFFGVPMEAQSINNRYFYVWALWVFFSLGGTLTWGIILVFSAPSPVHDIHVQVAPRDVQAKMAIWERWYDWLKWHIRSLTPHRDEHYKARLALLLSKTAAFVVVMFYICISEAQIQINNVLPGEHELWSFSQMAAILLALAPAWGIAVAAFDKKHRPTLPRYMSTTDSTGSNATAKPGGQRPANDSSHDRPHFPPMPEPFRPSGRLLQVPSGARALDSTASLVTLPGRTAVAAFLGSRGRSPTPPPPSHAPPYFPEIPQRSTSPTSMLSDDHDAPHAHIDDHAPSIRSLPWTAKHNPTGKPTMLDVNPYELAGESSKEAPWSPPNAPP